MESVQANPLKLYCTNTVLPFRPPVGNPACAIECPLSSPGNHVRCQADNESPMSSADFDAETVTFQSEPPETIRNLRYYAAQDAETCREVVITLELNRMRKARIGLRNWICFWERIYKHALADTIRNAVSVTFVEIDQLFRTTAQQICHVTSSTRKRMLQLRTVHEAKSIWRQMELRILRFRNMRRYRAQILFDELRCNLETIPVDVADALFDDLKRGVFALDPVGDYHPGDFEAEEWEKQVDGKLQAAAYITHQPDLPNRPGFTDDYQRVLHAASTGFEDRDDDTDGSRTEDTDWESEGSSSIDIEHSEVV